MADRGVQDIRGAGLNVLDCYQCRRCSAGCPVAYAMDYKPHQVIQMINLGMADNLLSCDTIWLCASCYTCSTRCPNNVDVAKTIDWLRQEALLKKITPPQKDVRAFHDAFLRSIRSHGRVHELSMIARYKMATGKYFDDIKLGWSMFLKGKLKLRPANVAQRKEIHELFAKKRD